VVTTLVTMVNNAFDCPAGTLTDAGTCATGEVLVRVTTTPPALAGPFRATVPRAALPPARIVGFTVSESRAIGMMLSADVFETPP
jgi:hypothetical protein